MAGSSALAAEIIAELISCGVTDFVVSPGSRSQALALTVAEAENRGLARLHVRIDERSAAFFALGIARETGRPAPVIVTSGSAVANLMPAVLEGHHARVPMILLTADRPQELHGVRSNQTVADTTYVGAFCRYRAHIPAVGVAPGDRGISEGDVTGLEDDVTGMSDALAAARDHAHRAFGAATGGNGIPGGPTHVNVAFRDPLSGESVFDEVLARKSTEPSVSRSAARMGGGADPLTFASTPSESLTTYVHGEDGDYPLTVVVAGADAGRAAADFAHDAGLPIFAEPSSGARFGRETIQHYDELLADADLAGLIERVVVFGHPTLSRAIVALAQRDDVRTIVIDEAADAAETHGIERFNPGRRAERFAQAATVAEEYSAEAVKPWLGAWVVRDRDLRALRTTVHAPDLQAATQTGYKERNEYARAEVARMREPVTREHLTETLWLATWPHDRLVVASSRLIRVLNRSAAPRNIRVHANRGLAGIDGTVATALGVAVASQSHDDPRHSAGTTRVLVGDLALLHDVGSLLLPDGDSEPRPRIQLIVGNDGGGSIFDQLEVASTADARAFDRVLYTPHDVNIEQLAAAYGWEYAHANNRGELERAFTAPVQAPSILEVPIARR